MNSIKDFLEFFTQISPETKELLENEKFPLKINNGEYTYEYRIKNNIKKYESMYEDNDGDYRIIVIDGRSSIIEYNESQKEIEIIWFHKGDRIKSITYSEDTRNLVFESKKLRIIYFLDGEFLHLDIKDKRISSYVENDLNKNSKDSWYLFGINFGSHYQLLFTTIENMAQNSGNNKEKDLKYIIELFYYEI